MGAFSKHIRSTWFFRWSFVVFGIFFSQIVDELLQRRQLALIDQIKFGDEITVNDFMERKRATCDEKTTTQLSVQHNSLKVFETRVQMSFFAQTHDFVKVRVVNVSVDAE